MSQWACTSILFAVLRHRFAHSLCHYVEWFLNAAPMSSNLSGSMSTSGEGISRNRMTFLIKLCCPEAAVGTLPLAGHRCFNFSDVTCDTTLPFNGSFHHIWSVGRWIRKLLYDWMVWDLTKFHECKHLSTDICILVYTLEDSSMDPWTLRWNNYKYYTSIYYIMTSIRKWWHWM